MSVHIDRGVVGGSAWLPMKVGEPESVCAVGSRPCTRRRESQGYRVVA